MTDPYRILCLDRDADDQQVRQAYLAAIRACPPERDAKRFEAVRQAYESLASQRDRLRHALFDTATPDLGDVLAWLEPEFRPQAPNTKHLLRVLGVKT